MNAPRDEAPKARKAKAAAKRPARRRKWARRLGILAAIVGVLVVAALIDVWTALGASASGTRRERMEASAQYRDGRFANPLPMQDWDYLEMTYKWFKGGENQVPTEPLPIVERQAADFSEAAPGGLRITWLGHATVLIEIDGLRILTDPNWSERAGPFTFFGPERFFPPPVPLEELPAIDVVLISHDHYDHLDMDAVQQLGKRGVVFVAPLGVGAHLEYWGVEAEHIVELDWWQRTAIEGVELVATPARHFSGRSLGDRDHTLWAGWALLGPKSRVYYSGDSAMSPDFASVGKQLGPFDATLLDCGAYDALWSDVHLGPEQAVDAHLALGGKLLIPVHWGTFNLALHGWTEPAERLLVAAESHGVQVAIPKPGQSIEPAEPPAVERWWPELPWATAEQAPVKSTGLDATEPSAD